MTATAQAESRRAFSRPGFHDAYSRLVLSNDFFESPDYYYQQESRYRRTLQYLVRLHLPKEAQIFEIGGGQIALLCQHLFGDRGTVGDVSEKYAESVTRHGVKFVKFDLLNDHFPEGRSYDAIVLCEVVEHLPVPLCTVLERLLPLLNSGGFVFITTPNLYRLRNLVRMASGRKIFCPFFYPEPGRILGHVLEYTRDHLCWQLERSGLEQIEIRHIQLCNRGSTLKTRLLRVVASPLLHVRPLWRDQLVAWGRKPTRGMPRSGTDSQRLKVASR